MKKLIATFMLLMFVTIGFAGGTTGAISNPKAHSLCYDEDGRFNPQNKNCDPNSCGCLFHQIEEFIADLFA